MYKPYRVTYWYQGRKSSTSFGDESAARTFAADMRKRGIKRILVSPV